jgi:lambda repressor-like predicted transcriptional regulator
MLKLDTEKIWNEMEKQGLTVIKIAKQKNVTSAWIYDILARKPITQAEMFADVLGLDPIDLIIKE